MANGTLCTKIVTCVQTELFVLLSVVSLSASKKAGLYLNAPACIEHYMKSINYQNRSFFYLEHMYSIRLMYNEKKKPLIVFLGKYSDRLHADPDVFILNFSEKTSFHHYENSTCINFHSHT